MFILVSVIIITIWIYYKFINPHNYWKNKGVHCPNTTIFFGNIWNTVAQKEGFAEINLKFYNQFPNERYFGIYQFTKPILCIRDTQLLKNMALKDFDHFSNHTGFTSEEIDPLWSKNLFASQGEKWRNMRPTLSPSFTSSKMKAMFTLISDCSEQFIDHFLEMKQDTITIDFKDIFTRYTNDVIATCAFGVKCDSLREKDNEFYLKGKDAADFTGLKPLRVFIYTVCPTIAKFFKITFFGTATSLFFRKLTRETVKHREENNIVRPDMIHLLMEARKGRQRQDEQVVEDKSFAAMDETEIDKKHIHRKLEITDDDITAQALIFFIAGFDTASTLMTFMAYELAVNKEIQDRLRQEVDHTLQECNGKLTYEALNKMQYLDMVVSETLRKWPPTVTTDRDCTKEYTIKSEKPGETPLVIEKGTTIWFPILAIQRDSQYYDDPERFNPERFNDENKGKIYPSIYLPFGIGPRNCIGSRFALMENKIIIFYILSNFEIVPVEKSVIPVKLSKKHFTITAEGGMWLGLKRRNK